MLKFEWDALRVGTQVAVHDDTDAELSLCRGVVAFVKSADDDNDIAIRIKRSGAQHSVVRPRRHAVHLLPVDPQASCWRCDLRAAS